MREAILNALIHRDYSIYTERQPIQIHLFEDRLEIKKSGGLYGRIQIDQLGKVQPDTRTLALATAMEILGVAENRYSGIPTMRRALEQAGMPEPEFRDDRGTFLVCFRKPTRAVQSKQLNITQDRSEIEDRLLRFCAVARTRQEIADLLDIKSVSYAITAYVAPLLRPDASRCLFQKSLEAESKNTSLRMLPKIQILSSLIPKTRSTMIIHDCDGAIDCLLVLLSHFPRLPASTTVTT